jgi:hypothetical protein
MNIAVGEALLIGLSAAVVLPALFSEQDANWDLQNYHYYYPGRSVTALTIAMCLPGAGSLTGSRDPLGPLRDTLDRPDVLGRDYGSPPVARDKRRYWVRPRQSISPRWVPASSTACQASPCWRPYRGRLPVTKPEP